MDRRITRVLRFLHVNFLRFIPRHANGSSLYEIVYVKLEKKNTYLHCTNLFPRSSFFLHKKSFHEVKACIVIYQFFEFMRKHQNIITSRNIVFFCFEILRNYDGESIKITKLET